MSRTADPHHSLFLALDRLYERGAPRAAYEVILRKFLAPDEVVHLAFRGNGWNIADPLLLVTDRRILRLREGVFGGWVKRGEVLAREVTGASMSSWGLFGRLTVHAAGGRSFRVRYDQGKDARAFVDGLNQLLAR